jgi:quercetin dioxygenase-like cupin family protein
MNNQENTKAKLYNFVNDISYAGNSVVSQKILDKPTGTVTLFSFDKDQRLSEHTAPFDAMVQIIEGKAEITVGGVLHRLFAGDTIIMPANIPHALYATEQYKMLLTMIKS